MFSDLIRIFEKLKFSLKSKFNIKLLKKHKKISMVFLFSRDLIEKEKLLVN